MVAESISFGLRCLASPTILPGLGMLAMASGVMPLDPDLEAVAKAVLGDDMMGIPSNIFFGVLGVTKISGVLGLWKKGPLSYLPYFVSFLACGVPAASAAYGHFELDEIAQACAAGIYIVILDFLFLIDLNSKMNDDRFKKKKE